MSFNKDWDLNAIHHHIWSMTYAMNNPRNDGFTTWPIKQDLYQLKWLIESALENAATYAPEQEWLNEQEQKKIWKILKS
jgi:hypothetical protein